MLIDNLLIAKQHRRKFQFEFMEALIIIKLFKLIILSNCRKKHYFRIICAII